MEWSLIIFAYNEGPTLEKVAIQCHTFLENNAHLNSEIILIDDGSTDQTEEITVKLLKRLPNLKVLRHPKNRGIGAALRSGYEMASKTYICAIPGDGQFDVMELTQIPPFSKNVFYAFYRRDKQYSLFRKVLTFINAEMNRYMLKVYLKDVNWIKVYRLDQLRKAGISLESSLIETELASKLLRSGVVAKELPSEYLTREAGQPKGGNLKTLSQAVGELWKLYFSRKRL
jgi:glycosyltransferase involved in cell wall biosynthesis